MPRLSTKGISFLIRIEGSGSYTFANGNLYKGEFKDGHFHGKGIIYFVGGGTLSANWDHGIATDVLYEIMQEQYTFKDGLKYDLQNWDYCTSSDRRFYTERVNGFVPGEPQLADTGTTGFIPINTKEGYVSFDMGKNMLYDFDGQELRAPNETEAAELKMRSYSHAKDT